MKHWVRLPVCILLLVSACCLMLRPQIAVRAIANGLSVCAGSILPSLFPFFVLTNLWISLGYASRLSRRAEPPVRALFHLPGAAASPLLLGALGGYPVGAQTVVRLREQGMLSQAQAQQTLLFCNNAGPAFIFGILGYGLFQSTAVGAVLWGIHLGSALLLGLLFRPARPSDGDFGLIPEPDRTPFLPALSRAVAQAGETALRVCTFVLFFSVLTGYLKQSVPAGWQSAGWFSVALGSLELAGGARLLASSTLSPAGVFVAAAGLLGWGGVCVHCQTLSVLSSSGLSPKRYLFGKALHSLVSTAAACLAAPFVLSDRACFSLSEAMPVWLFALPLLLLIPLLLKSSSGKSGRKRV